MRKELAFLAFLAGGVFLSANPVFAQAIDKEAFANDIDTMMIDRYMKAYFPKIIDNNGGGVYMCFNRQFNPTTPCTKNLDMEARHLFSTSMASILRPEYAGFKQAADAIYVYIRDRLWDKSNGGSGIRGGSTTGQIPPSCDKPVYHNGFALVGLSAYYLATHDTTALDMAISTWKWIESKAYDNQYGMYYGWLNSDGSLSAETNITGGGRNGGMNKNQDILHHWIEGMAWLYIAWPPNRPDAADRALLKRRIKESADIFTSNKWIRSDGSIILYNNREMTAGSQVNNGLDAEDVYLFYFYYMAIDETPPQTAIDNLKRVHAYVRTKSAPGRHFETQWWPDAELFTSYCSMAINYNAGDSYLQDCKTHWEYIKAHYFDPQYGGWYRDPDATTSLRGDEWQCTYHGFKCMLFARNMLLGSQKGWIDPRIPVVPPPDAGSGGAGGGGSTGGAGAGGGGGGGAGGMDAGAAGRGGSSGAAGRGGSSGAGGGGAGGRGGSSGPGGGGGGSGGNSTTASGGSGTATGGSATGGSSTTSSGGSGTATGGSAIGGNSTTSSGGSGTATGGIPIGGSGTTASGGSGIATGGSAIGESSKGTSCSCSLGGRDQHGAVGWELLFTAFFLLILKSRLRPQKRRNFIPLFPL